MVYANDVIVCILRLSSASTASSELWLLYFIGLSTDRPYVVEAVAILLPGSMRFCLFDLLHNSQFLLPDLKIVGTDCVLQVSFVPRWKFKEWSGSTKMNGSGECILTSDWLKFQLIAFAFFGYHCSSPFTSLTYSIYCRSFCKSIKREVVYQNYEYTKRPHNFWKDNNMTPSQDSNNNTNKQQEAQPLATMTTTAVATPTAQGTANIAVKQLPASSAPIALPTRMVLSALAGMGAATMCHPLGECNFACNVYLRIRILV